MHEKCSPPPSPLPLKYLQKNTAHKNPFPGTPPLNYEGRIKKEAEMIDIFQNIHSE